MTFEMFRYVDLFELDEFSDHVGAYLVQRRFVREINRPQRVFGS